MKKSRKTNIVITRASTKVSGAEIYNIHLLPYIVKRSKISISVISNNKEFVKKLQSVGIRSKKAVLLNEVGTKRELLKVMFLAPLLIPISILGIHSYLRKGQKNIVVMESMSEKIFLTSILKLFKVKVIWLEHGPIYITKRSQIIKKAYKHFSTFSDAIIAVSEDTKKDLITGGIMRKKIHRIYIGIDPMTVKKNNTKKMNKLTIVFLGTIGKEKGILRFINTASILSKYSSNLDFVVIGDGPLLKESKRIVRKKKMSRVFKFLGHVDKSTNYLTSSDILLLPTSHQEGLSLAILESLAAGLIVVTKDIGGNRELVINNKSGILYKTFNQDEIAKKIKNIIDDKELQKRLRKGAKLHVKKNFNIHKNITNFITLFRNV